MAACALIVPYDHVARSSFYCVAFRGEERLENVEQNNPVTHI